MGAHASIRVSRQGKAVYLNFRNILRVLCESLDPSGANTSSTGFGFVRATPDQAGSNPVLGSGGARSIQLGLKLIF